MNKILSLSTVVAIMSFCSASAMEQNTNNDAPTRAENTRWVQYAKGTSRLKQLESNPNVRRNLFEQYDNQGEPNYPSKKVNSFRCMQYRRYGIRVQESNPNVQRNLLKQFDDNQENVGDFFYPVKS